MLSPIPSTVLQKSDDGWSVYSVPNAKYAQKACFAICLSVLYDMGIIWVDVSAFEYYKYVVRLIVRGIYYYYNIVWRQASLIYDDGEFQFSDLSLRKFCNV